uniref:CTTNBP2 N-terminal like n=1 Tax=Molossus molossus TaxID=27622 RepID=A0A7J8CQ72_MOLMO|nr:CTTNBP2 N-terminal like [Molossus molossus]
MNLEKLSKPELLTLFSILEGELEARDLVIEALKAQHRDTFIEERYGKYNISDPLMALQRDFETLKEKNEGEKQPVCTNPLSILKVVMKQCKNMQERMLSQLAAAESRHRKVILDLEEERQRHAQDTAEGDDVTYMLEKERERLTQQLEFEKSQVKKFEKEQKKLSGQLEEERARHKQLSSMLVLECKKASSKAAEEGQRAGELSLKLEKEKGRVSELEEQLAAERKRGLQTEAQVEKQLSEFDIEREQLRAKLNREENRTKTLKEEMESLKKIVKDLEASHQHSSSNEQSKKPVTTSKGTVTEPPRLVSVFCQTEGFQAERTHGSNLAKTTTSGLPGPTTPTYCYAKANGHFDPEMQMTKELITGSNVENQVPPREKSVGLAQEKAVENGGCPGGTDSPVPVPSPLSPGIKSPTIPRAERGNPPPIPPKKPGLTPSSSAATPLTKTHSPASSLTTTEDLTSSCSSNVVANGKDVEILLPTSS